MATKKSTSVKPGKSYKENVGKGGEIHQASRSAPVLTTTQGTPIADNQNSLRAGARGPGLLEDRQLREKLFHFDHERIPERVVHARGFGAHGYFETLDTLEGVTCASLFKRKGIKTPVFARFSTVAGNKGSADLARDVRGFAVKFYTQEGNWDLVGNNIPVFFIQDAMKFPDLIHAAKAEPDRGFPQAQTAHDNFWDFISLTPESMHMVMWIMSDRAIPRSLRFMEGFGVHTFRFINAEGKSTFVKFHWKPAQGMQSVTWDEALRINGADPDYHRRDMWNAIQSGDYPTWELGVQLFGETFAEQFEFDVLDATKLIPEEQVPVKIVGRMVLNKAVDNFFAETEQVAFCTQNLVPGIDQSNDPLLQGRNFSYLDTQLKRLGGPNFTHIPINAPKCPVHNFMQDGHMAMHNRAGRANYEPNSWGGEEGGPREDSETGYVSYPEPMTGEKVRQRSETFSDHYSQANQFYRSQTDVEQAHIADALVFELSKVERRDIRERMVSHLLNIDRGLAKNVARKLGISTMPKPAPAARKPIMDLPVSDALSINKSSQPTLAGRTFGVFLSNGADNKLLKNLKRLLKKEGADYDLITPTIQGTTLSDGEVITGDETYEGGPSALYDVVVVIVSDEQRGLFTTTPAARHFIEDAYRHSKYIAFSSNLQETVEQLLNGRECDQAMFSLSKKADIENFLTSARALRYWDRNDG
ncbi:catalase [Hahella aquimaris]|uniref:catalase n=1 Tax=Hahella sp. HNIBRBA332 TaxID=3015983 RepID=UPI00273C1908|nr:catalase [Hahella sp. HNIBRBA332]WLQ16462.1 catalase [Hahella sp. HNIBRBA332]